ncbi:MAG: sensor domain-containing diguanylate cyclase [Syntrophales bacterium]
MQEKTLQHWLLIIISTIVVLPYLALCYIFYDRQLILSPVHFALLLLILALAVMGVMLVRYVFEAVSVTADSLKKTAESGDSQSLNLHQKIMELDDISSSFNTVMKRLEKTTESLDHTVEKLQQTDEEYHKVLENIEEGYYEVDIAGNFTFFNNTISKILGYSKEELRGMNNLRYMDEENAKKALLCCSNIYRTGIPEKNMEVELLRKDGKSVIVEASISLIRDPSGQSVGLRGIIHDITERRRMEEEIISLSITDHLTGIHNRRGFEALAEQQLKIRERTKEQLFLLFADLDNTKGINDNFGHENGDMALIEVASILKDVFRKSDIIARIGGNEFVVLGIESPENDSEILASRLQQRIGVHNTRGNEDYQISLSIGIARSDPDKPCTIDELMSKADTLMYQHKRSMRL